MPVVTGVKERRGRARVFVDGELWAELDSCFVAERGLREGTTISHEELAEARIAGERPLAMNRALHSLGYRARSAHELRERLSRAGYALETVSGVLTRLEQLGYLDDEEFARNAARDKARKRYGPRRIYGELRRAGVTEEIAQGVVEEEFAGRSEFEEARASAQRRYNTGERSDAQARRVHGFLMRRGYSAVVSAEIARSYRRETNDG
jgi:regulatory protein